MREPDEPTSSSPEPQGGESERPRVFSVAEEEASISRREEKAGAAVRVRVAPHEAKEQVSLTDIVEKISVQRVPVNRFVSGRISFREEGEVVIVPVFENVAVVEMGLLLKGEIRIVRQRHEVPRKEKVGLRKEAPIIQRKESDQGEWRQAPPD